jgi:aminobenzoyl-glutamate utilization protein B
MRLARRVLPIAVFVLGATLLPSAQVAGDRLAALKKEVAADVESRKVFTQRMVDTIFSFSEVGFEEVETQAYVTSILEKEGFRVERGVAGMPTAWVARWGSGKPIIALGTDEDCIPAANQTPGVVTRKEIVPGAPGHGEGHNAGQALIVTAALAAKKIMEREKIGGTLLLFPGIAEELLAGKAHYVRAGLFKDVDIVLYNHVGSRMGASWGDSGGSGLVSLEYTFKGETSHAAAAPWRGRSALDAVELMNIGWNYRREHLRLSQRTHYVITNGGDQPNVVPAEASVWYYYRETDYDNIKRMWAIGDQMAAGAAMMTGTEWTSRMLGSAWPAHANRTIAETLHSNAVGVGMPQWSDADQQFARALQKAMGAPQTGLVTDIPARSPGRELVPDSEKTGGASDDIGDVMWTVPTATLAFAANVPGTTPHHWTSAVAMATPVAHKGTTQAAKVEAMTILDFLLRPELVQQARAYFDQVQGKQHKYVSFLRPGDQPPITINRTLMDRYRPALKKVYYDQSKFASYLEQLGVAYPPQ